MPPLVWRLALLFALAVGAVTIWRVPNVPAAEVTYLRIAAGTAESIGFHEATALAAALSRPPGLPPCETGRPCGIPGLVALAQSMAAADDVVAAVAEARVETGIVPANLVFGARCPLSGPARDVTVLADLYEELLHVLARPGAGIVGLPDIVGKRVAVGTLGSEERRLADRILMAHGMRRRDIRLVELAGDAALEALAAGEVDVAFRIAPVGDPAVARLAGTGQVALVPVAGAAAEALTAMAPFSGPGIIPGGTYGEIGEVETLAQPVVWIAHSGVPTDLAGRLSAALADPQNRKLLDTQDGTPRLAAGDAWAGRLPAPLHPGAAERVAAGADGLLPCPD